MQGISSIKISPVAKYLAEKKATAIRDNHTKGLVRFFNPEGDYLGYLKHTLTPNESTVCIKLYESKGEHPFLKQFTAVKKTLRCFVPEFKYIPVKIDINRTLTDYNNKVIKSESMGHGLVQDRYIEEVKTDSPEKPENTAIFRINKPFKYDFKYHLYYPDKRIDCVAIDETSELIK